MANGKSRADGITHRFSLFQIFVHNLKKASVKPTKAKLLCLDNEIQHERVLGTSLKKTAKLSNKIKKYYQNIRSFTRAFPKMLSTIFHINHTVAS